MTAAEKNLIDHEKSNDVDSVVPMGILGEWISTESSIDLATGDRADPFETVTNVERK